MLRIYVLYCYFSVINIVLGHNYIYFHEPSRILIQPTPSNNTSSLSSDNSRFGYALAYQKGRNDLVVGAPNTKYGKVYSCNMNDTEKIVCHENVIDFKSLAKETDIRGNVQNFNLGASIATTSDYFFTCAPLWTSTLNYMENKRIVSHDDAYGTCFKFNGTAHRYEGPFEKTVKTVSTSTVVDLLSGGIGWFNFIDEDNDLLLVLRKCPEYDFIFAKLSQPDLTTKSMRMEQTYLSDGGRTDAYKMMDDLKNKFHTHHVYAVVSGHFFSNETVYAVSIESEDMSGAIIFLDYNNVYNYMSLMRFSIRYSSPGTMFGSALGAADVNCDGLTDLLVGVPGDLDEECLECGAVHIYLLKGGAPKAETRRRRKSIIDEKPKIWKILGNDVKGRFGSAITTHDVDGDSKSEIIVSAIYEDNGNGVLYVFSGFEVMSILKENTIRSLSISDFRWTQKIHMEPFRSLGFSLQLVADLDHNGCNDLAVGSPGNDKVLLLKCLPAINVTIDAKKIGDEFVKELDTYFTIEVCANITYPVSEENVIGQLSITNKIEDTHGAAKIAKLYQMYTVDISTNNYTKHRRFCENVTVTLVDNDPNEYMFMTMAQLDVGNITENKDFNAAWVMIGVHSELSKTVTVRRPVCDGDHCRPRLNCTLLWIGHGDRKNDLSYIVGSSLAEYFNVAVDNHGGSAHKPCVQIQSRGVQTQLGTYRNKYDLRRPFYRNENQTISLELKMDKPTNVYSELLINSSLYEDCSQMNDPVQSEIMIINYILPTNNIAVTGLSHSRNITQKEVADSNGDTINDDHEYTIINNGNITWKNVTAEISMKKTIAIQSFNVLASNCEKYDNNESYTYTCILNLNLNSSEKVLISTEIFTSEVVKQAGLNTTSVLKVHLRPTLEIKTFSVTTDIVYMKEEWYENPLYIGLLAAIIGLIILFLIAFILYKVGFFKRNEQVKLLQAKESIRRRSIKHSVRSHVSKSDGEGLEMDVDEDPFDEIEPVSCINT